MGLAEQNRLIIETMDLVEPIAALYRGQKHIPFEDLVASGREGLVKAARNWRRASSFRTFAGYCIHSEIRHFIRDWQEQDTRGLTIHYPAEDIDEKIYEWRLYQTPYESWDKLGATPEEIVNSWQESKKLAHTRNALSGAILSLSKRERAVIAARFLSDPPRSFVSTARELRISYKAAIKSLERALRKLRKIIGAQERNREAADRSSVWV